MTGLEWDLVRLAGPGVIVAVLLAASAMISVMRSLRLAYPLAVAVGGAGAAAIAFMGYQAMMAGQADAPRLGFMAMLLALIGFVMTAAAPSLLRAERTPAPSASLALLLVALAMTAGQTLMAQTAFDHLMFLEALALTVALGGVVSARASPIVDTAGLWRLTAWGLGGVLLAAGLALGGASMAGAVGLGFVCAGLLMRSGAAPFHGPFGLLATAGGTAFGPLAGWVLALSAIMVLPTMLAGADHAELSPLAGLVVGAIGAAGAVWAALQAASSVDLRRFVSGIAAAQCGLILIGCALGGENGVAAALSHAVTATIMLVGLHYGVACLAPRLGEAVPFTALDGLSRRRPLAAATLMVCALSSVGAPLTAGFLSKWMLIEAVLAQGWWWAAAAVVAASLAVIMPVGALIERLYFMAPDPRAEAPQLSAVALAPVLLGAALLTVLLGVDAADLAAWAAFAAKGAS